MINKNARWLTYVITTLDCLTYGLMILVIREVFIVVIEPSVNALGCLIGLYLSMVASAFCTFYITVTNRG